MPTRQIIQIANANDHSHDDTLRVPQPLVSDFGEGLRALVADLVATISEHPIAVGLAAPQIGVLARVSVINVSKDRSEPPLVLVNPVVVSETGKKDAKFESCMSVPGLKGSVVRRENIVVEFQDVHGLAQKLEAHGFLARVICHEVDHLNGILYLDRMAAGVEPELTDLFDKDHN